MTCRLLPVAGMVIEGEVRPGAVVSGTSKGTDPTARLQTENDSQW